MPLGISAPGRRRKVSIREPGDLPSAVITREHVGRGVQTLRHAANAGRPAATIVAAARALPGLAAIAFPGSIRLRASIIAAQELEAPGRRARSDAHQERHSGKWSIG